MRALGARSSVTAASEMWTSRQLGCLPLALPVMARDSVRSIAPPLMVGAQLLGLAAPQELLQELLVLPVKHFRILGLRVEPWRALEVLRPW